MRSRTALVRRPSPLLADGLVTHKAREAIDLDRADRQWHAYVDALRAAGWETVEVPPAQNCPDSVFVEDTMVAFRDVAVLARPAAPSRSDEIAAVEPVVAELGYTVERIRAPATLEGGDVLKVGDQVYVGCGGRTNRAGIAQLDEILSPHGAAVIAVPISKVLHLKSAVTALPDGTVVGLASLLDDASVFPGLLAVPEEAGAHVVCVGDDRVLMASGAPRSEALFRARGYHPLTVDIDEFVKLEGCVTCLSVRLRG